MALLTRQSLSVEQQTQVPLTQVGVACGLEPQSVWQLVPHPPQLLTSVLGFTQAPPQHV